MKEDNGEYESTPADHQAFLGFHILMAINYLPSVDDYWKKDNLMHYSPLADRISRDHFRELSKYLHFVNNNTLFTRDDSNHDQLGKVRPIIDHLS